MRPPKYDPVAVYRNIVIRYGTNRVDQLIARFLAGESSEAIAADYGVSSERVCQWRSHLIVEAREYKVYPDVQSVANEGLKLVPSSP